MANEKTYHGHTLNQIQDMYYVHFNGDEDYGQLKELNGRLSELWQTVAHFYEDTKRHLDRAKDEFRRATSQLELDIAHTKMRLIKENQGLPKGQRWSDKARETLALTENMDAERKKYFDDLEADIAKWKEEKDIWHEVRQNMRFIAERVQNAQISNAVEAKHTKTWETPVDKVQRELEDKKHEDYFKEDVTPPDATKQVRVIKGVPKEIDKVVGDDGELQDPKPLEKNNDDKTEEKTPF